jgi:hypothetical protein
VGICLNKGVENPAYCTSPFVHFRPIPPGGIPDAPGVYGVTPSLRLRVDGRPRTRRRASTPTRGTSLPGVDSRPLAGLGLGRRAAARPGVRRHTHTSADVRIHPPTSADGRRRPPPCVDVRMCMYACVCVRMRAYVCVDVCMCMYVYAPIVRGGRGGGLGSVHARSQINFSKSIFWAYPPL